MPIRELKPNRHLKNASFMHHLCNRLSFMHGLCTVYAKTLLLVRVVDLSGAPRRLDVLAINGTTVCGQVCRAPDERSNSVGNPEPRKLAVEA